MEQQQRNDEINVQEEEFQKLIQCLPKVPMRGGPFQLIKYQDFWYHTDDPIFKNVVTFQKHFVAHDTDIFIASYPKTGSTWLKSLLFAILNRAKCPINDSPLRTNHPHEVVYSLETDVYSQAFEYPKPHHLDELPAPRLLSTHVPYTSLPESIKTSGCRILYICRNPLDTIVSYYYYSLEFFKNYAKGDHDQNKCPPIEDIFEDFCEGRILFGPFFEHVLGFWKASLERSEKMLFLKYEDLKDDPIFHVKKLAEFVGMPFSSQEESEGVIQQIVEFCSIKNIKNLDVNKSGVINKFFEKKSYFRKGEVGDWSNHFTPTMVEKMHKLMEEKLEGSGLSFKFLPN